MAVDGTGADGDAQSGFTLLEALVALSILGVALLLEMAGQWQALELRRGLEEERALMWRAEATVESLRAGVHPLASGPIDMLLAWPLVEPAPSLTLRLDVEPTEVEGLCRVEVRARSIGARRRLHTLTLETMVWRPGAVCS